MTQIKLSGTMDDRRRKLTDDDRAKIVEIRQKTGLSYSKIAFIFNVSSTLVQMLCNPTKKKQWLAKSVALQRSGKYRKTRAERQKIYQEHLEYKKLVAKKRGL